jgi:hypothetical protein
VRALADSIGFLTAIEVLDLVVLVCWAAFDIASRLRGRDRHD